MSVATVADGIPAPGLGPPAGRLLAAARATLGAVARADDVRVAGLRSDGGDPFEPIAGAGESDRILVLGWIGTHPDARSTALRQLWELEERARGSGAPTLALRLAPLVGPRAPLSAMLARRPHLDARLARAIVQPLHEDDAVAALARALGGGVAWRGAWELCGPDPWTVGELAGLEAARSDRTAGVAPAWEPSRALLLEQGLGECALWADAFGITPRSPAAGASRS